MTNWLILYWYQWRALRPSFHPKKSESSPNSRQVNDTWYAVGGPFQDTFSTYIIIIIIIIITLFTEGNTLRHIHNITYN
jgi:hypothetical protein